MSTFHIMSSGKAAPCDATTRPCPLGGEHYSSMRDAAVASARAQGDTVTFGKYRGCPLDDLLADNGYCYWLLQQRWFKRDHPALYRRVRRVQEMDRLREDFNRI